MALPAIVGALSLSASLDLTSVGNAVAFPIAGTKRLSLSLNGITGSGATLAIDGSRNGGATWVSTGLQVIDYDLGTALTSIVDDGDYRLITKAYTHIQLRVVTAGSGSALALPVSLARPSDTALIGAVVGGGGGPASSVTVTNTVAVTDPAAEAALGAPTDAPWSSGAGTLVGLLKALNNRYLTPFAVTVSGMLPAGTNFLGYFGLANGPLTYAAAAAGTATATSSKMVDPGTYANFILLGGDTTAASDVFFAFGTVGSTTAVVGSGFSAAAGGGTLLLSKFGPLPMPAAGQAIYAISRSGTVNVPIQGA